MNYQEPTISYVSENGERTARYDRKLAEILTCAARIIAEEGFEGASIRKVAREADMSLAGLYYYFKKKEELLYLIQYHTFDSILNNLKHRFASVENPEEQLRHVVENHFSYFLLLFPLVF